MVLIIPALIGLAGAAAAGGLSAWGAKSAADKSSKYAQRIAMNQYQWTVKDMQAAGLNPILAYQQGANAAPMPHTPNVLEGLSENVAGMASKASELMTAKIARDNMKKEGEVLDASKMKFRMEAGKANADMLHAAEQAETERALRGGRLAHLISEVNQSSALQRHVDSQVLTEGLQRQLLELGLSEAKATSDVYKNVPWLKYGQEGMKSLPNIPFFLGRFSSGAKDVRDWYSPKNYRNKGFNPYGER